MRITGNAGLSALGNEIVAQMSAFIHDRAALGNPKPIPNMLVVIHGVHWMSVLPEMVRRLRSCFVQDDGGHDAGDPEARCSIETLTCANDPMVSPHELSEYIDEGLRDALFRQLWECEEDRSFKPYASAALSFARVARLSRTARGALYRDIATGQRAAVLDRLSHLNGWKSKYRLLSKTNYQFFHERDWRALFNATNEGGTRQALGHLSAISTVLIRQISEVPEQMRTPALLRVLNHLKVSSARWRQLADAWAEAPPQLRPSFIAKAKAITARATFWDYFFACVENQWQPFDFPESFLSCPELRPLRTTKDLDRESRKMRNCLDIQAPNVRQGRHAYFQWQGPQPATVQLVNANGWKVGNILGRHNEPLPLPLLNNIQSSAESLVSKTHHEINARNDEVNSTIRKLRAHGASLYSSGERADLSAALRSIRQETQGLDAIPYATCILWFCENLVLFTAFKNTDEFICEIQSHRFNAFLALRLSDEVVSLIINSGFSWPRGRIKNFTRWLHVTSDAAIEALSELGFGILHEVFGHIPGSELFVDPRKLPNFIPILSAS